VSESAGHFEDERAGGAGGDSARVLGELPAGFLLARVGEDGDPASFLELRRATDREGRGVRCDLSTIRLRGGASEARGMPVVRALGEARTVVDATAGLLGDAFLIAVAGREVTAIERSRVVYELAKDGLARAMRDPVLSELLGGRLQLVHADARAWLATRAGTSGAPDAVLMDPMFPPKKRASALPRKEMVMLREMVGADLDAAELLRVARESARQRVILKRGDDAPELAKPDWSIEGTTVRFDGWLAGAVSR
jgi:16S rRNA (guanine1516-N2)-methyltransferase